MLTYRKVGGLHFWRVGRLGGSFYIAARKPFAAHAETSAIDGMLAALATAMILPCLI